MLECNRDAPRGLGWTLEPIYLVSVIELGLRFCLEYYVVPVSPLSSVCGTPICELHCIYAIYLDYFFYSLAFVLDSLVGDSFIGEVDCALAQLITNEGVGL